MAAAAVPTLFNQAVSRILSSWAALQIAVEHGFGGSNSKQKAQDLVNDIERLFQENKNLDPYDFAGYLEDEVDDRFDLVVEDGSVDMIATHICQCSTLLKEGRIPEVEQFLQGLPGAGHSRVQCAGGDSSSEEDDDDENMDNSSSQPQQRLSQQQQQCSPLQNQSGADGGETSSEMPSNSTNGAGDAPMDVEEEDGWTVVRKGGRKR